MIEQIPLTLKVHDAVMIGPATVGMLCHDESLIFVWSHRVLAHCVCQHLGTIPHIGISKVEVAVILECKRTLSLTAWQSFKAVHAKHLELAVAPLHGFLRSVVCQFLHVVL